MARRTKHEALITSLVARLAGWRMTQRLAAAERDPEGRTWYRIDNRGEASTPIDVFIYGEIGFWGVTAEAFLTDLGQHGSRDITLRINSEGGEVFDGVAIYNALQRHAGRIEGHVDGLAASAASFIAMACDEIVVEPGAQMMIHDAIGMCYGNAAEMTKMVKMLNTTSDTIAAIYAERAGGAPADWRALMSAEDTWYDGPAAVAAGLADRVGEVRERRPGPEDASRAKVVNYDPSQPRDGDGRFADGMPDVIASYDVATLAGALSARRTREGVELTDGAHSVTLTPNEQRRLVSAVGNDYRDEPVDIHRYVQRADGVHAVTVARVRPSGGQSENDGGEITRAGVRLDIGEVDDSDEYDSRTGVTMTTRQAGRQFETTLNSAAVAERVQTGYGPLDMFPAAGNGMGLRVKGDDGTPVEVRFSRAEWRRIDGAVNLVLEGFDEDLPEGQPEINRVTVPTKAGRVDVEWSGPRIDGGGYSPDAKLKITPQDESAGWSVIVDGEHMSGFFGPIGFVNDAIGIDNTAARLKVFGRRNWTPAMRTAPAGRPRLVDRDYTRDDEGRFATTPGVGRTSWDAFGEAFAVLDELGTANGLVTSVLTDGRAQLSFDDAEDADGRYVLWTVEPDDFDDLETALDAVINGPVGTDAGVGGEPDGGSALLIEKIEIDGQEVVQLSATAVSRPDYREEHLELQIDLDEAADLLRNISRAAALAHQVFVPEDAWRGLISAYAEPSWAPPDWAGAHSTSEPVSSPSDDHEAPWEAWV